MTIILSIKPYYLYLILIGQKTIELRKSFPQRKEWDKTAFLYCTKDMKSFAQIPEEDQGWMRDKLGKIACKVVIDDIDKVFCAYGTLYCEKNSQPNKLEQLCLTIDEVRNYLGKKRIGYDWHIAFLLLFEPRELTEFAKVSFAKGGAEERGGGIFASSLLTITSNLISLPPQSWCYALEAC